MWKVIWCDSDDPNRILGVDAYCWRTSEEAVEAERGAVLRDLAAARAGSRRNTYDPRDLQAELAGCDLLEAALEVRGKARDPLPPTAARDEILRLRQALRGVLGVLEKNRPYVEQLPVHFVRETLADAERIVREALGETPS